MKDGVSAKPQIFVIHDGSFTYNLVTNLAHFLTLKAPDIQALDPVSLDVVSANPLKPETLRDTR